MVILAFIVAILSIVTFVTEYIRSDNRRERLLSIGLALLVAAWVLQLVLAGTSSITIN